MHTIHRQRLYAQLRRHLNESTQGTYNTPSHDGIIWNESFAYREKDHKGLNKYSILSKLSLKAASNPVFMWLISQLKLLGCLKFNHTPTKIWKHFPLYNSVGSPQISSTVFDMMLPARFIYNHVISPLFISTHEWHDSYGKPLGGNTFLSTWFWLSRSWHRVSCYNRRYYNSGFNSHLLLLWAADSDDRAKWLDGLGIALACLGLATPLLKT